ncbi:DUF3536 domain-containing protein [Candidatus Avelusimicrobium caledoniensis]|uniref:DUF3536 domain-containing protein n=1 Tax=Candidatus Avelusimicrobium caledoniensis TaxID=3416220 RepID=UPI003D0AAF97
MKYLCIHGHFYQPPRENAWLDMIEQQDSAAPFHDWNERICAECYGPNALARLLDGQQNLIQLTNNYSRISFNFGPTLLSWMEKQEPEVYYAILEADKISQTRFGGHGSAIAQVYNHIILPLANARDKETQIKWGIADFTKRFGRQPEALWLAETACDTPTLCALADAGMKFVILAPGQCARVRKIGAEKWEEVGAAVDPKRAYQCNLPNGKQIALFFYDGPISQGIAFSDTLSSGEKLASRLLGAYNHSEEAQLMHIATDGETYGHHQKFADMSLAYCLKKVEETPDVNLTVYGEFLEKYPPQYEAQIVENSSWSCCHGVERWRADCGCNSGRAGWHQKWRAPLRAALDFVRDELIKTFETVGKEYFKDPWAARNDYVDLMSDRSLNAQHCFFLKHATEKAWNDRAGALMLLEMQKNALFMYTSCGWFFDEISGIETVQIMQYACRALELNKRLTGNDLEPAFVEKLAAAPSNIKELKNGARVYERYVKPQTTPIEKLALEHIITLMADETTNPHRAFSCEVLSFAPRKLTAPHARLWAGEIALKSTVTLVEQKFCFAVFRRGAAEFTCAVQPHDGTDPSGWLNELETLFNAQKYEEVHAVIVKHLVHVYTVSSMINDVRRKVMQSTFRKMDEQTDVSFSKLFEAQYPVVRALQVIGAPVPPAFIPVAEFVLAEDIKAEIRAADINIGSLEELMEDVKALGLNIAPRVNDVVTDKVTNLAFAFARNPEKTSAAMKLVELLNYAEIFGFKPDTVKAQEFVFLGIENLGETAKNKDLVRALARKLKIAL